MSIITAVICSQNNIFIVVAAYNQWKKYINYFISYIVYLYHVYCTHTQIHMHKMDRYGKQTNT